MAYHRHGINHRSKHQQRGGGRHLYCALLRASLRANAAAYRARRAARIKQTAPYQHQQAAAARARKASIK